MHGLRSYIKWSMISYESGGSSDVSKQENRSRMLQRDKKFDLYFTPRHYRIHYYYMTRKGGEEASQVNISFSYIVWILITTTIWHGNYFKPKDFILFYGD